MTSKKHFEYWQRMRADFVDGLDATLRDLPPPWEVPHDCAQFLVQEMDATGTGTAWVCQVCDNVYAEVA